MYPHRTITLEEDHSVLDGFNLDFYVTWKKRGRAVKDSEEFDDYWDEVVGIEDIRFVRAYRDGEYQPLRVLRESRGSEHPVELTPDEIEKFFREYRGRLEAQLPPHVKKVIGID